MTRSVKFPDGEAEVSDEFSNRDFTSHKDAIVIPAGAVVYASCFSRETPDAAVFDPAMTGVTFRNCNLMNVRVPDGNFLIDCQQEIFRVQNDGNDWIVDRFDAPLKPLCHMVFTKRGLPMPQAKDIPAVKVEKTIDLIAEAMAKVIV